MADEDDRYEEPEIELGDTYKMTCDLYKEVEGLVYYRDENLIRILPTGVSLKLYDFPLVDNDFDKEVLGNVMPPELLDKRRFPGFIEQQDLRKGQLLETFTEDGEDAGKYEIVELFPDDDIAYFQDEVGSTPLKVDFNYRGVPLDLPFSIIRTREPPAEAAPPKDELLAEDALERQAEEEAAAGIALPEEAAAAATAVAESDAEGGLPEGTTVEDVEATEQLDGDLPVATQGAAVPIKITGSIIVPVFKRLQVVPMEQRVYPDTIQKADALQDFTTLLSEKEQQDVRELRRIRMLTETLFLMKQELVEYNDDGTFKRSRPSSFETVSDLLQGTAVPLSRPVLKVVLRLYESIPDVDDDTPADSKRVFTLVDNTNRELTVEEASSAKRDYIEMVRAQLNDGVLNEQQIESVVESLASEFNPNGANDFLEPIKIVNLYDELREIKSFLSPAISSMGATIQFWITLQAYIERFGRPWKPLGNEGADDDENIWLAKTDSEFFRGRVPDPNSREIRGIRPEEDHKPETLTVDDVHFSLQRALGPTYRNNQEHKKVILFNAEGGDQGLNLIFPFAYKSSLGATRTGYLTDDIVNSHDDKIYMAEIIRRTDGVQESAKSDGILAVGVYGNTLGNITLADYIATLALKGYGPADIHRQLSHIGMRHVEWNEQQGAEISKKIAGYINATKTFVKQLRDELAAAPGDAMPAPNTLFSKEDLAWLFNETIPGEPLLAETATAFAKQSPRLVNSDFAALSPLIVKHLDYFLAAAGKNESQIARERSRTTRNNFLTALRIAMKVRNAVRGEAPQVNRCEHVKLLRDIRRIPEEKDRMQHLVKFLVRFQGPRKDNWITCSVCARDLLCVHEIIQLKQFMNKREFEALNKELMLNFTGPVMGSTHQCRNCGQAMMEIAFDNNVQFDDNGRPMTGNAVLEDTEQEQLNEIDKALGVREENAPTEMDFGTESRNLIYRTIREIADRVGVYPTKTDYDVMIGQVQAVVADIGDRETFVKTQAAAAAAAGKKGAKLPDYEMIINRTLVLAAGAYLLINIQCKIPDYMPSISLAGCKNPGFRGYPMDTPDNTQGMEYISCAIGTIMRNTVPWNLTGFQREKDDAKRQKLILSKVALIIQGAVDLPDVQQQIASKRKYRQEIYGSGGEAREQLNPFFLPPQKIITAKDAAEAGTTIIPEVKGDMTVAARSDVWIQEANQIAAQTASERGELIVGSPFAEGTCCYDSSPQSFWESKALPPLPPKELRPGALVTRLLVRFVPRAQEKLLADQPENLYYILFLNVCFSGERLGLPHEPGLNHKCPHCDFQFPGSLQLMDLADGKTALEAQGVEVSQETFTALLDACHQRYSVPAYVRADILDAVETMRLVGAVDPAPAIGWAGIVEQTIMNFQQLPPDASVVDVQEALADLSQVGAAAMQQLEERLPPATMEKIAGLVSQSAANVAELTLSYLIVPFNRLITQLIPASLETFQPALDQDLAPEHKKALKEKVLQTETYIQRTFMSRVNKAAFAKVKLEHCVRQLRQIPVLLQKVTATNIPGGERTMKYLLKSLVCAPLASLVNPNEIPEGLPMQEANQVLIDGSLGLIYDILNKTFIKYDEQILSYSDKELRDELQIRAEKEKAEIIREFAEMDDDKKQVELMLKNMRMGRWAVGGTKAITQYNKDQYERERIERAKAGISDFSTGGFGPEGPELAERPIGDAHGIFNFGGEGEGAYDMERMAEDDY
jgi:hypothetical protein